MRGQRYDRHGGVGAFQQPDPARRLEAVHLRHFDVHQDEVVVRLGDGLQRRGAVADDIDQMPAAPEHAGGDLLIDRIVIGHKDAQPADRREALRRCRRAAWDAPATGRHACGAASPYRAGAAG